MDFGGGDEIRFERVGMAGVVTLARPQALNALTHGMIKALTGALMAWQDDSDVAIVVVKADGRAFSAGGDIMQVYNARGTGDGALEFFADEYRLNARIAAYPKPYVALIDGIAMGGGVGIAFHGSHRIMTENAQFAMPEVGIGFFPDVGGSYLLANAKGSFGMYLALTTHRARHGDALWAGLASYAVASADVPQLFRELCRTGEPEPALKEVCHVPPRETDDAAIHAIAQHFDHREIGDVIQSLAKAAPRDQFAKSALESIEQRSPTSLKVAFRAIQAGAMLTLEECLCMEFRITSRMLDGLDFYEGIRAAVVEKGSTPRWQPASLEEVSEAAVEAYFAPIPGKELDL